MKRFLDLFALGALAFVVLIPRPGVEVKPAVEKLSTAVVERIAELQAALLGDPTNLEAAVEAAQIYRDISQPEWALATLGPFRERGKNDYRVHFGIGIAHAQRLELTASHRALTDGLAACRRNQGPVPCGPGPEARMRMIHSGLQRIVDLKIDPVKQPEVVQAIMFGTLRTGTIKPPAARPLKAPASAPSDD